MAWVAAPKEVISKLVQAKQGADLQCSTFDQMVAFEVGRGGFIDRHVHRLREVYGRRRDVMLAALEKAFPDRRSACRGPGRRAGCSCGRGCPSGSTRPSC